MRFFACWILLGGTIALVSSEDRFQYENVSDWDQRIMGPSDWGEVGCEDLATCVSNEWRIDKLSLR